MTEESKLKLKAAASEASKGTIRGGGSTVAWGYAVWVVLVEKVEWSLILNKGRADSFTFLVVGLVAGALTGFFRLMEQRHPNSFWSTMLLSQGAPSYDGTQQSQPTVTTVTTNNAQVTITDPAAATPPPADPVVVPPAIPPLFSPGDPEVPPAVASPIISVGTVNVGSPVSALDDPESDDTSATSVVTDPDDLLDGGDH